MNKRQLGFGGLQVLVAVTAMAVISVVAVPKYNGFLAKAKMTEAFNMAGVSRTKLNEYYMINGSFPTDFAEANSMRTDTLTKPEHVKEMLVEPVRDGQGITVKVFLNDGVIDNPTGAEQFIFMAGKRLPDNGSMLQWTCGASGVEVDLLPMECQG